MELGQCPDLLLPLSIFPTSVPPEPPPPVERHHQRNQHIVGAAVDFRGQLVSALSILWLLHFVHPQIPNHCLEALAHLWTFLRRHVGYHVLPVVQAAGLHHPLQLHPVLVCDAHVLHHALDVLRPALCHEFEIRLSALRQVARNRTSRDARGGLTRDHEGNVEIDVLARSTYQANDSVALAVGGAPAPQIYLCGYDNLRISEHMHTQSIEKRNGQQHY